MAVESVEEILNHAEVAISRLHQKYKDPSNRWEFDGQPATAWEIILQAFIAPGQGLETILNSMLTQRGLYTAVGVNLDRIGQIVGLDRQGEGDSRYRELIIAKIAENDSDGTGNNLLRVANLMIGSIGEAHGIVERFPAKVRMDYALDEGSTALSPTSVQEAMERAKLAGVGVSSLRMVKDNYFGFSSDPDATGFGTLGGGEALGGKYSTLVEGD